MSSDQAPTLPGLPTGMLTVTVTQFRSLGALTELQATLSDWTGFYTAPGVPMPQPPPTLTLSDNDVAISSTGPIRLIFNLPDPRYVLLGVAWQADVRQNNVGEKTFPSVFIERDACVDASFKSGLSSGTFLTITDNAQNPGYYEYVLLIQDVSTGEIGMFDPGMDNEGQD
ncbi:hypothetical protein [Oleiharenicola lentus]|uniref:hypothetical protein n=1 Tax=Oleiharenicola lentus TaxID=2508720 RepID=UPI003F681B5A